MMRGILYVGLAFLSALDWLKNRNFGGKIRFHGANEAAGSPDFRTYFTFSLSQKLTSQIDFEILHVKCIV